MEFKLVKHGERVTLEMVGRFDVNVSFEFFAMTAKLMHQNLEDDVEIDMAGVTYVDSAALGKLIHFSQQLKEANRRLSIVNVQPAVRKIFDMFQLSKLMTIA